MNGWNNTFQVMPAKSLPILGCTNKDDSSTWVKCARAEDGNFYPIEEQNLRIIKGSAAVAYPAYWIELRI